MSLFRKLKNKMERYDKIQESHKKVESFNDSVHVHDVIDWKDELNITLKEHKELLNAHAKALENVLTFGWAIFLLLIVVILIIGVVVWLHRRTDARLRRLEGEVGNQMELNNMSRRRRRRNS